ncbi:MAG: DUF3147 family protein [Gammaproteobacteria bacterium]|nr:DUF3147 family protein [Gammaproteobacteria bacterium]
MAYLIFKILVSALIIVAVAEISKRSTLAGGLLVSLPTISLLAMIWLYIDTKSVEKVAQLSHSIFWLIFPTFSLFLALPILIKKGLGFYPALAVSIAIMLLLYLVMILALKRFDVQL